MSSIDTLEAVDALLVDDDDQWATFLVEDIEAAADWLSVTHVSNANEAMAVLDESDDIECVVSDYRMPGIDGLQLLRQIRADRPDLPYILVTGAGSESVAADAIDAGATDYVVKQRSDTQAEEFVRKIERAVRESRLRDAVEQREERYRSVTEQVSEGICIVQREAIQFCNDRLVELTGRDRDWLRGEQISNAFHQADRQTVREALNEWYAGGSSESLRAGRIVRPDGTARQCEYTGQRITEKGQPAVLLSIRDVTERQQRERELAWQRDLERSVQRELVGATARADAERGVVQQLQEYGYDLAWIGEQVEGELLPRAVAGGSAYVESIDLSVENDGNASEPTIWAARTGECQFHADFETLFETPWREAATEHGLRSGLGVPLVYNDIVYGFLGLYSDESDQFDETERRLVGSLAESIAFACHSFGTERALSADETVEVTLQVSDGYYLLDVARDRAFLDCDNIIVHGTIRHGVDEFAQYITVYGGDLSSIRDQIGRHSAVQDITVVRESRPFQLQVIVTEVVPEALLAANGVAVVQTTIGSDGATIDAELPASASPNKVVSALESDHDTVTVLSVINRTGEKVPTGDLVGWRDLLTEKQREALQAAYLHGYFDSPRRNTATEVAESLGVSHSTFLRHLRAGQQKLLNAMIDSPRE